MEAARLAALAGAGGAALPFHCVVADETRNRRLIRLFADSQLQNTSVFAVYSCRHHVGAKIKTFNDFSTSHLRQMLDGILPDEHTHEMPGHLMRAVENV
ncbi:type 2 periplasmic-binding domain-containing protein [Paraburkholderia diazotrophica]|uniref:hypothetical protein n=1 Tax=Paraburkholderia diazotrophica TaxID=667676 RepID=UPI001FE3B162